MILKYIVHEDVICSGVVELYLVFNVNVGHWREENVNSNWG